MTRFKMARTTLGLFFMLAGALHFIVPGYYENIVPPYLPAASALVALSGAAEIAGGLGLLLPRFREAAGLGLMLLLVLIFPANVEMLRLAQLREASPGAQLLLWLRLPLQALLIWWTWLLSRPEHQSRGA